MSIVIDTKTMKEVCKIMGSCINTKTPLQILRGVLLERTDKNVLRASATNMDWSVRINIKPETGDMLNGVILLNDLKAATKSANGAMQITLTNPRGEIKSAGMTQQVETFSADEYPVIQQEPQGGLSWIPSDTSRFAQALSYVKQAVAKSDDREVLQHVWMTGTAGRGELIIEATDGRRAHREVVYLTHLLEKDVRTYVHVGMADSLLAYLKTRIEGPPVYFDLNERLLHISVRNVGWTRVEPADGIMGRFPSLEQLTPKSFANEITLTVGDVRRACQAVIALKSSDGPLIEFDFGREQVCMKGITHDGMTGMSMSTPVLHGTGEVPVSRALNAKYIMDALHGKADNDTFVMFGNDSLSMISIDRRALVMPIRIKKVEG